MDHLEDYIDYIINLINMDHLEDYIDYIINLINIRSFGSMEDQRKNRRSDPVFP